MKTTTPEVLNAAIDYLNRLIAIMEKHHLDYASYGIDHLTLPIKQNIKHLKLMRISEEYRLKQ